MDERSREKFESSATGMFNTIVLPPTNFESAYDNRDNDEVLSDIRHVKSELENSALQDTTVAHTFEQRQSDGVVTILIDSENANSTKTMRPTSSTDAMLVNSPLFETKIPSTGGGSYDSNLIESDTENPETGFITIEVTDCSAKKLEVSNTGDGLEENSHSHNNLSKKHLSLRKSLSVLTGSQMESMKNLVKIPNLDVEIEETIKQKLKSSSDAQKRASNALLITDNSLKTLQLGFRTLSAPILEVVSLIKEKKNVNLESKVIDILGQLVSLNEQVVTIRRNCVLEYFKKKKDVSENFDMPEDPAHLFGTHFVNANKLFEVKKLKPSKAGAVPESQISNPVSEGNVALGGGIPGILVDSRGVSDMSEQDDILSEIIWDNQAKASRPLKRISKRATRALRARRKPAHHEAQRSYPPAGEKRRRKNVDSISDKAQILVDINSDRRSRRSTKARVEHVEIQQSPTEIFNGGDDNEGDNTYVEYRNSVSFTAGIAQDSDENEDEDDENGGNTLDHAKGVLQSYSPLGRRNDCIDSTCEHCDYVADKRRKLIHHIKTYHPDKLISCELCEKKFAFQVSLWNHKNAMHLGAEFECPQCTRSFKDAEKLQTHMFVHSSLKPFVCEVCGKGCLTKVHLDSHIKVHERRSNLYCQTCDRYFGSNHTFRNHVKLHSGAKEWFCDICNAGFPIKPRLVLHKKIAHSDEQFVCEECGKGFKMKHILNDHKALLHSSKKAFVCEICGVGFKLRSVLKRHMKTHSDERPHKCDLCDKAFKVKSTLVEHRKTHTNEKPYLCDQCGMAFKRNAERRKHNCVNKIDTRVADRTTDTGDVPIEGLVSGTLQQAQLQSQQSQLPISAPSNLHLQSPTPIAVHAQSVAVTAGHIVAHMPLQIAPQMIQLMPHSTTLISAGSQLMHVNDDQLSTVSSAQFTNFSVS